MELEDEADDRRAVARAVQVGEPLAADEDLTGVGRSSAPIRFSSVLLPQPDGPVTADELARLDAERDVDERGDPARPRTTRETWSTTTSAPPLRAVTSPGPVGERPPSLRAVFTVTRNVSLIPCASAGTGRSRGTCP